MKKILFLLSLLWIASSAIAQSNNTANGRSDSNGPISGVGESEEEIYIITEQEPKFPGGKKGLTKYLSKNLHYPEAARENNIEGRVIVQFVIEKDGNVSNIKVLRDIGGGCGEEAIRVIQEMPKWTPAKQRGKPVRCQFTLPLNFHLE